MIAKSFKVALEFDHKIFFTENIFDPQNPLLSDLLFDRIDSTKSEGVFHIAAVVDTGVLAANIHFELLLANFFTNCTESSRNTKAIKFKTLVVPLRGGEAAKTFSELQRLLALLDSNGIDKQSVLIGIGGGAVLDVVGLCATLFHRGMPLIRVPTTVLAQNDAGIGVKNGINAFGQKNFLGTFGVPLAVINDIRFIETLPDRFKNAGYAEAIKVALLKDKHFFDWILENQAGLAKFDRNAVSALIKRSAMLHCEHISAAGDPFEQGAARPLDLGHWAAHKLECLSNHEIAHGEAVALGLLIDTLYSVVEFGLSRQVFEALFDLLQTLGLPTWARQLDLTVPNNNNNNNNNPVNTHELGPMNIPAVFMGVEEFRKHLGGKLSIPFLKEIGSVVCAEQIDFGIMQTILSELKLRAEHEVPPKFFAPPRSNNRERDSLLC